MWLDADAPFCKNIKAIALSENTVKLGSYSTFATPLFIIPSYEYHRAVCIGPILSNAVKCADSLEIGTLWITALNSYSRPPKQGFPKTRYQKGFEFSMSPAHNALPI